MKGKITMTICVGCTALILTMVMFTQFKTVDQTDITAIETMRETELRTELTSWKTKYEDIETKIEERDSKINEYKQELNNNYNNIKDKLKTYNYVVENINNNNIISKVVGNSILNVTCTKLGIINSDNVRMHKNTFS